ncbi:MAG: hypothetical protein LCH53_13145 [Bacteroidetes bacterium]|nr:hypothetical protein [Bacteroidota bacterium]
MKSTNLNTPEGLEAAIQSAQRFANKFAFLAKATSEYGPGTACMCCGQEKEYEKGDPTYFDIELEGVLHHASGEMLRSFLPPRAEVLALPAEQVRKAAESAKSAAEDEIRRLRTYRKGLAESFTSKPQ